MDRSSMRRVPSFIVCFPCFLLTQERSCLAGVATDKAEDGGLEGVDGDGDTETEGSPVDGRLLLLGKDTEQVPGQNQGTS